MSSTKMEEVSGLITCSYAQIKQWNGQGDTPHTTGVTASLTDANQYLYVQDCTSQQLLLLMHKIRILMCLILAI